MKPLLQIAICLLILRSAISVEGCDETKGKVIYKCADKSFRDDKCMITEFHQIDQNKENINYYLQNCGCSETCRNVQTDSENYGICTERYMIGFEGDKCIEDSECYSRICKEKKCVQNPDGTICDNSYQCGKDSICTQDNNLQKCQKIVAANEKCDGISEKCPIGYACGKIKNDLFVDETCLPMFSIKNGEFASHHLLCESGYLYIENTSSDYNYNPFRRDSYANKKVFCADATFVASSEKCSSNSDCKYRITGLPDSQTLQGQCLCSLNTEGYCQIATDNQVWKDWKAKYIEVLKDIDVKELKSISYAKNNGLENPELMYAEKMRLNYVKYKNLDECALRFHMNSNKLTLSTIILFLLFALLY